MRIVRISGGLGNQMFQYAFSLALKAAGNSDVKLDLSAYSRKANYNGIDLIHNGFELTNLFNINFCEANKKEVARLSYQPKSILYRFLRKYFTKRTHFIDKLFSFQPVLFKLPNDDIYLEGDWQSEKYFLGIEDEIRKAFTFKKPLSPKSEKLANSLGKSSASIHIRRGDYLKTQTMNVCGIPYYKTAVRMLFDKTNITELLVFSDDLDWCRKELKLESFGAKVIYVDWNIGNDSWQDMALMSKCGNHIIANSSFSWWGAWLDSNKDKIVICPTVWDLRQLNPEIDKYYHFRYDDIIPSSWIKCPLYSNCVERIKNDKTEECILKPEYTPENASVLFPDKRLIEGTDLQKAQQVMLRILKVFDAICSKYNLTYWLDAGTLLGAARHEGFIPWDDDVDTVMPIDDYNKFLSIAEKELPFDMFFQTHETDPSHDITWAKIRDRFSYMDDPGGPYPYCQGIPIDIFPVYLQTKNEFLHSNIRGLLPPFNNKPLKTSLRYSLKHNAYNFMWGTIQRFYKLLFKVPAIKMHYLRRIVSSGKNTETGFTYAPGSPWFIFFPENCVFPLSKIKFEDTCFFAPHDIEKYLTLYYGNWRKLPPENKRNIHNTKGIHITDAGPKPDVHSLKWEDYHK